MNPNKTDQYSKKQKNMIHNEQNSQLKNTDPEITKMIELVDKNVKVAIINILHMFRKVKHKEQNSCKTQIELLEVEKKQWLKSATDYAFKKNLLT